MSDGYTQMDSVASVSCRHLKIQLRLTTWAFAALSCSASQPTRNCGSFDDFISLTTIYQELCTTRLHRSRRQANSQKCPHSTWAKSTAGERHQQDLQTTQHRTLAQAIAKVWKISAHTTVAVRFTRVTFWGGMFQTRLWTRFLSLSGNKIKSFRRW